MQAPLPLEAFFISAICSVVVYRLMYANKEED